MKKLIEIAQEYLIECDNSTCDYVIVNENCDPNTELGEFINKPCPKCGDNLLTIEDYLTYNKVLSSVNWINKWLNWLTYLIPSKYEKKESVKIHNGINRKEK